MFFVRRVFAGGPRERRNDRADLQAAQFDCTETPDAAAGWRQLLERYAVGERAVAVVATARLPPRESQV